MGFRLVLFLMFVLCSAAHAISLEREAELNTQFKAYCEQASKYVIKNRLTVTCGNDFHHYNSRAAQNHYGANDSSKVRIASYNTLHPGSNKNSFKDIALVARIMDEYDLISVQELIPRLGNDMRHNDKLVELIERTSDSDLESLYRSPGYLLLLDELRKLDPSWALITSPRGEASSPSSVHEMLGFYYRAKVVRPINNEHCEEFATDKNIDEVFQTKGNFACFPLFRPPFFRADVADAFSRKPFLASFESGKFDFSIINAHVIFTSPKDEETMRWISNTAFGQEDYSQVGVGVTKETYARFAEVRLTVEMLDLLTKRYKEQDIIFAADMNLEKRVAYWDKLFQDFSDFKLFGDMATSLTPYRYSGGDTETNGFSSNYDHFMLNKSAMKGCDKDEKGEVIVTRQSYFEGHVDEWIKSRYFVREETLNADQPYRFSKFAESIINERMQEQRSMLENTFTIDKDEIVPQYDDIDRELEIFKRRIFDEQLSDFTYYKFYRELISDHYPISITCDI